MKHDVMMLSAVACFACSIGCIGQDASNDIETSTLTEGVVAEEDTVREDAFHGYADPLAGIRPVTFLHTGFQLGEGPSWFAGPGVLRFSSVFGNQIFQLDGRDALSVWRADSAWANGLGVSRSGETIACEAGTRSLTRSTSPDSRMVIASTYRGARFNEPNDNAIRRDGRIYFTDPLFGDPSQRELDFQGVFRIATNGAVSLVSDEFTAPNGIAFSPDQSKLYVTDSELDELYVFNVALNGSTGPRRKIADTNNTPDGMTVDDHGNLYIATEAGIDVYRADGTLRGNIPVPEQPTNCAFGGTDRRTLYITTFASIYKVRLNIPGKSQ